MTERNILLTDADTSSSPDSCSPLFLMFTHTDATRVVRKLITPARTKQRDTTITRPFCPALPTPAPSHRTRNATMDAKPRHSASGSATFVLGVIRRHENLGARTTVYAINATRPTRATLYGVSRNISDARTILALARTMHLDA